MAKAKKEQKEELPQPSVITYWVNDAQVIRDMMESSDEKWEGIQLAATKDKIVLYFNREVSIDEAVVIGAILGKWEHRVRETMKDDKTTT